ALAALGFAVCLSRPLGACSLCGYQIKKAPFSEDCGRSAAIVYGRAVSSNLSTEPTALPGSGSTEFRIDKIVKSHRALGKQTTLSLNRYIPVLDPKNPPALVVFFDASGERLIFHSARQVKSATVIDYLAGAQALQGKDRVEALRYYARFLDHE